MRKHLSGAALAALILVSAAPSSLHAETLADAIALAYETNPTLQAQRATLRATDEGYVQARSGFRPSASLSADGSFQDRAGVESDSGSLSLSASQPLFTGGRAGSAVAAAENEVLAGRQALRRVEATVLQSVIQAYVDVRRDEQLLAVRQENVRVLETQVEQSEVRFEVGEITRTDVAQSQASLAAARSQLAAAQSQLAISRSTYAAVVGQNPGTLEAEPDLPLAAATVEAAFDEAERNNPTLLAAQYAEQASRARVAAARAERLPSVGLRATLGYSGQLSPFDPNDYSRNVTASATFSQPLFAGGAIASRVRQAVERNNADRINVEAARRTLLQTLAQAWNQLLAARASIASNEEGVRAATIAFEGVQEEQRVGLRTTLEVLTAQQNLLNARLALINARRDGYVAEAAVLNAMGLLEARTLIPDGPVYDPEASFRRVRASGFVPWEPVVQGLDSLVSPAVRRLEPDADAARAPPRPESAVGLDAPQ